jgi:DNA-binding GntR family transcriptional regulator
VSATILRADPRSHPTNKVAVEEENATGRAITAIRELIARRELLPGEQIRQHELAEKINASRTPLREALRALTAEGLVRHSPNQGYFVIRLGASEISQIYTMRRLLETELLRSIERPDNKLIKRLAVLNDKMNATSSLATILGCNREFHLSIFELSPLKLFIANVKPLWDLCDSFRGTFLVMPKPRAQMYSEHTAIIDRLREYDCPGLVAIHDEHRRLAEEEAIALSAVGA